MDYDEVLDILNAEYNGNYQEIFTEIDPSSSFDIYFFFEFLKLHLHQF